ncbi:MAG: 4-(cytidine 5'-diphospho)-2-C-methyl-D-erythritol kinase [Candidatus Neomarinimicrobiota bacterium]
MLLWLWLPCPLSNRRSARGIILPLISSCKINVGLKVTGKRHDGYHTIQTIFQELDLTDTVILESADEGWEIRCNSKSVPRNESNSCVRAYLSLKELFPDLGGIRIGLEKRIPVGSGLGGGSSNAATVLRGLNELFGLALSDDRLEEMGGTIGADVPFFIRGGTQFGEGLGDILSPVTLPYVGAVLLVVPETSVSTEWAYDRVRKHLTGGFKSGKFGAVLQSRGEERFVSSWAVADRFLENDFESLVFQTYPEIGDIRDRLRDAGALFASLSGTGSTVFGIFGDEIRARRAQAVLSSPLQTFITHPIRKVH